MTPPRAVRPALDSLLWASESLLAARMDRDGVVIEVNPALERWAGYSLTGVAIGTLLHEGQRPTFERALAAAGEEWSQIGLGFEAEPPRPAEDRTVFLLRRDDEILLVAEAAVGERDGLVAQVLELNEDLIKTQRSLNRRGRELERAQAEAAAAAGRMRRLETIMLQGLSAPDQATLFASLLSVTCDVLECHGAAVLLRDEQQRRLVVEASTGPEPAGAARQRVWIVLDGAVVGVLEASSPRGGAFSGDDVELLEAIADRAALALGHLRMRDREREVAEALQRSVLPHELPELANVDLCARYLPRTGGVGVGGDFYDALALEDGRLSIAIGDVAGKGVRAASTMGRLCHAMRAYAIDNDPAQVLERLDRLTVDEGDEMATAQHFVLDPSSGALVYANGGHPPALRITAAGETLWLREALSPPLGADIGQRAQATARLDPGDRLLLFTDGLIERRGESLDVGLLALAERAAATSSVAELCHDVVDLTGAEADGFEDDVAVIAIAVRDGSG